MTILTQRSTSAALLAMAVFPLASVAMAQTTTADQDIVVTGEALIPDDLSSLPEGPEIEGFISARSGDRMQVTGSTGQRTGVTLAQATQVRSSSGLFGINRKKLDASALYNGLPVTVQTVEWQGQLLAKQVKFKGKDLRTASMIRNGTAQQFDAQGRAINQNAAATDALRGRLGDIDQYNIKSTTNVYFDTGRHNLSGQAKNELCAAAAQAESTDNALLLVVGYTDSTGSQEVNQRLSEKRAGGVVNYLQQACGWKPWRMLTPTGMAEADPAADNTTAYGKAQNRRVAVNILVSKSVDGI